MNMPGLGGSKIFRRFLMTIVQRDSVHDDCRAAHLRETDCVADDAVSGELVSAPNSLLTGKLTGNFAIPGLSSDFHI
jgi:hypothetical protein